MYIHCNMIMMYIEITVLIHVIVEIQIKIKKLKFIKCRQSELNTIQSCIRTKAFVWLIPTLT